MVPGSDETPNVEQRNVALSELVEKSFDRLERSEDISPEEASQMLEKLDKIEESDLFELGLGVFNKWEEAKDKLNSIIESGLEEKDSTADDVEVEATVDNIDLEKILNVLDKLGLKAIREWEIIQQKINTADKENAAEIENILQESAQVIQALRVCFNKAGETIDKLPDDMKGEEARGLRSIRFSSDNIRQEVIFKLKSTLFPSLKLEDIKEKFKQSDEDVFNQAEQKYGNAELVEGEIIEDSLVQVAGAEGGDSKPPNGPPVIDIPIDDDANPEDGERTESPFDRLIARLVADTREVREIIEGVGGILDDDLKRELRERLERYLDEINDNLEFINGFMENLNLNLIETKALNQDTTRLEAELGVATNYVERFEHLIGIIDRIRDTYDLREPEPEVASHFENLDEFSLEKAKEFENKVNTLKKWFESNVGVNPRHEVNIPELEDISPIDFLEKIRSEFENDIISVLEESADPKKRLSARNLKMELLAPSITLEAAMLQREEESILADFPEFERLFNRVDELKIDFNDFDSEAGDLDVLETILNELRTIKDAADAKYEDEKSTNASVKQNKQEESIASKLKAKLVELNELLGQVESKLISDKKIRPLRRVIDEILGFSGKELEDMGLSDKLTHADALLKAWEVYRDSWRLVEFSAGDQQKIDHELIKDRYAKARTVVGLSHPELSYGPSLDRFRNDTLKSILHQWFTNSVNRPDESRPTLEIAMYEHLLKLRDSFLDFSDDDYRTGLRKKIELRHAEELRHLEGPDHEDERAARINELFDFEAEGIAIDNWKNLVELVFSVYVLADFEVMNSHTLNLSQYTAKHEEILKSAHIDGAMKWNEGFNQNPMVNSEGIDPSEMMHFTEDASGRQIDLSRAGLLQKIVYAMYQEMRKDKDDEEYNRSIVTDGSATHSVFTRNEKFTANQASHLLDAVCEMNQIRVLDTDNLIPKDEGDLSKGYKISDQVISVGIKDELDAMPHDVRDLIKMFASFKAARDDIGSMAGIWHLGYSKGAFKYNDGADGKPAGLLSGILYQVGKNTARERHAAILNFIDPRGMETMVSGRPGDYESKNHTAWKDGKNSEVVRIAEQIYQFRRYSHPQWEKVSDRVRKFKPQHWYQDFPGLAQFFNQEGETTLPADYIKARDAVLKIIEFAADSDLVSLSTITPQMVEKLRVQMKAMNSEVGKALAYIGAWGENPKFNHVHELMLAAYQYYISNYLMAVPGEIPLPRTNPGGFRTREYEELYSTAVRTITAVINGNSTLTIGYQYFLTGYKNSQPPIGSMEPRDNFVGDPGFKRVWRDHQRLRNQYQSWMLKHDTAYTGGGKDPGIFTRVETVNSQPLTPINVKEGWKSSFEDQSAEAK